MRDQHLPRWRVSLMVIVLLAELAHLLWEYFNGGVQRHHLLNRSDLPAISNWWGILVLPALTWFLTGRCQTRIELHSGGKAALATLPLSIVAGFVGSLLFGIALSVSFTNNYESAAALLFLGMFLLAILLPVYRAECVLGFVLGMTFTFGAVLPLAVGCVIAALSVTIHRLVYPVLVRCWKWFRWRWSPTP